MMKTYQINSAFIIFSVFFLLSCSLFGNDSEDSKNNSDFVQIDDASMVVSGDKFHVAGTNAYYLPNYQLIDSSVVNRALDLFEESDIRAVRMWAFYDGPPIYQNDNSIQPQPRQYNENSLIALDQVIAKGKEKGIYFILPFINYWSELGGIEVYNGWCGESGRNMSAFINNQECQSIFKDYVSMLLNRVNTVTGIAYKDEPAIMLWEIGNELRNPEGSAEELRDWYQDIAQFIKSIDSNHLVATGEEGFDDASLGEFTSNGSFVHPYYTSSDYSNTYVLRADQGTSYVLNTQIPEIDVASAHWYPDVFGFGLQLDDELNTAQAAWLRDHQTIANDLGKPFILGEYGLPGWGSEDVLNNYNDVWSLSENLEIGGTLLWQLTADYVKCWEFGGNICWPAGREDEALYNNFVQHIETMNSIR